MFNYDYASPPPNVDTHNCQTLAEGRGRDSEKHRTLNKHRTAVFIILCMVTLLEHLFFVVKEQYLKHAQ